jgi:hypothetical protein
VSGYEMNGVPFLFENRTYVPVRDIAEAFDIHVDFNAQDRFVILRSADRTMFIPPELSYGATYHFYPNISSPVEAVMYHGNEMSKEVYLFKRRLDNLKERSTHIIINDRSYVPLRLIMDFFNFTVSHDETTNMVSVEGVTEIQPVGNIFSNEQEKIINAFASFESAKFILYRGLDLGYPRGASANHTREISLSDGIIANLYHISSSDGVTYETEKNHHLLDINGYVYPITEGGTTVKGSKILPSGETASIISHGANIEQLVLNIGDTLLSGSNKYKEMTVIKSSESDATETFLVSMIDGAEVHAEVEIDKNSGKLYHYSQAFRRELSKRNMSWFVIY